MVLWSYSLVTLQTAPGDEGSFLEDTFSIPSVDTYMKHHFQLRLLIDEWKYLGMRKVIANPDRSIHVNSAS